MRKTYIFGHKKPDTDSVMASIGLSYLKNQLKEDTEPRVLGNINKESRYALKYFDVKEPEYLNDVKLQIMDVNYHKDFLIKENDSIYHGYQLMLRKGLTGLPVTKEDLEFVGLITMKDLSHMIINENIDNLDSTYENIIHVINGEEVLKIDDNIKGKIMVAAYKSTTFKDSVELKEDTILIVGDRHSIIEYATDSKIKLLIISGNCDIKPEHIEIAKRNNVNIIRTPYDSYHISRMLIYANNIKTMIGSYNPTKFEDTEYVDTVLEINNKLKHTNYPVVNKNNKCLGLLRITDLNEKNPKKVILVDHSEKLQTADGIEEAKILEIVDHHNLGSITTSQPINFRNMAVGSTCTILFTLYKEKNIKIPKKIAGVLLSGILSDTLILKSPTTTQKDIDAVDILSKIAEVDYKEYGMNMLKAGTSLEGMSKEDLIYNDYKLYTINEKTFAISQFFTMNFDDIKKDINSYIKILDSTCEANNYSMMALYVTDIIKNGSYVIYNTKAEDKMKIAYNDLDVEQGFFVENCVSRKKNVVPLIMDLFDN